MDHTFSLLDEAVTKYKNMNFSLRMSHLFLGVQAWWISHQYAHKKDEKKAEEDANSLWKENLLTETQTPSQSVWWGSEKSFAQEITRAEHPLFTQQRPHVPMRDIQQIYLLLSRIFLKDVVLHWNLWSIIIIIKTLSFCWRLYVKL